MSVDGSRKDELQPGITLLGHLQLVKSAFAHGFKILKNLYPHYLLYICSTLFYILPAERSTGEPRQVLRLTQKVSQKVGRGN